MKKECSIEHPSVLCFAIDCGAVKLYCRSRICPEEREAAVFYFSSDPRQAFLLFVSGPVRFCFWSLTSFLILVWQAEGRKFVSTITVNGVVGAGWKYLRLFYLMPLRRCAKGWRQNRNWGRTWLVNVTSTTPGQTESIFPTGDCKLWIVCLPALTKNRTNSNCNVTTGWEKG